MSTSEYMRLAFEEARLGIAVASPNPVVGAVLARDGRVVGKGHHVYADRKHAEIVALEQAGGELVGDTADPVQAAIGFQACEDHKCDMPRGLRLAICTNKLEWLSVRLLETLGLAPRFDAICGADTFKVAKPDPRILHRTIAKCGVGERESVMVGDSPRR